MQNRNTFIVFVFLHILINTGTSSRILGLFPNPTYSHFLMFETLLKELVMRGHEVDVLSHFPQKDQISRFNDLSLKGTMPVFLNNVSAAACDSTLRTRLSLMRFIFQQVGIGACEETLNVGVVRNLYKTKIKYDLVITEIFSNDCMLGFGHHFGVPVISMISSTDLPWGSVRLGNPINPSYYPMYFYRYGGQRDLFQKLDHIFVLMLSKFWHLYMQDKTTSIARQFFGDDLPHLQKLASNTSLIFVNSHPSLNTALPNVPNVIEVSGLHIKPKLPSKDLADMLNATSIQYKGVVYFSMGSMVLTETLPRDKLLALFGAFSELPYQILWKASAEKIPKDISIPSNIKFQPWLPQLEVLCHHNVKLFITHGGLMGTQEAIYCGVPCLGIPLFADQHLNVNALVENDMALSIDYDTFDKDAILRASNELLNNPKYKENAEIASIRFKDRPLSPLDTAVYWVEYVIRHKGARHLRSPAADLAWYEYYLLDVCGVLIVGTLITLYITYKTIALLFRILQGLVKQKKPKND